jgi:hypothetical protein
MGVPLGSSSSQIKNSVDILKETDISRTLFTLKRNEEQTLASSDDHGSFVLDEASKLSEDLLEEEGNKIVDHKDLPVLLKNELENCKKNKRKSNCQLAVVKG